MPDLEKQSAKAKESSGLEVSKALRDIAPHVEKFEMQIAATRKLPFDSPKHKIQLEAKLNKLVDAFLKVWKEQLITTLEKNYKQSLNRDIQEAKDRFGKAIQKRKFKKKENIKQIDLSFVLANMERVLRSAVAVEIEYHRRKLAMMILFKQEEV